MLSKEFLKEVTSGKGKFPTEFVKWFDKEWEKAIKKLRSNRNESERRDV